jgi:hypothetical protein
MNSIQKKAATAIFAGVLATASLASAQVSTTTTTTSAGTVDTLSPDVVTVHSTTSTAPISYSFSRTTTYVDEAGNPVARETIRSGAPVTIYYTQDGDKMIASKVVVRKTTTTTDGATDTTTVKKTTTTTEQQ